MKINPAKCFEVTGDNISSITRRVLKDKGMRFTQQFVPAESEYILPLSKSKRIVINLTDDKFVRLDQSFYKNKGWRTDLEMVNRGSLKDVEQDMLFAIQSYMDRLILRNKVKNIK